MAKRRKKRNTGLRMSTPEFMEYLDKLAQQPRPPFKPLAVYNETGDIIEVHWKECDYVAHWLNHQVTILKERETNEIVGCQIWALDYKGKNSLISQLVKRESKKKAKERRAWKQAERRLAAKAK